MLILRLLIGFILTFGLAWLLPFVGGSLGRLPWSRSRLSCLCWVGPGWAVVLPAMGVILGILKSFKVLLVGVFF